MISKEKLEIVSYKSEHRLRFKEINEQWITRRFVLEEEDKKTLENPESYILENGGRIFIALYNDYPVGTCAYLNLGNGIFEMIKMAIDEKFRGRKIGYNICYYSIQELRKMGANSIFLFSNTEGSSEAIRLYHKLGFKEVPLGESEFVRANIKMELLF